MKLNGYDKIEAVVSRGTHLNALIFAAGENSDRSQPRTNADIQNIVEMFLTDPELCQWSNAQIARWAQVDAQTVTNHERRLMSTPNFGIENRPETRKFINKHGNISERKAPPPPASDAIRVSPHGETVKLGGLRSVLGRLHAEGSLDDQVGDGTRHASLYETTPENVLALRDEILADSEQAKEEEGPDLKGLKEAVYDLLDEEGRIYVPELAHKYSVPLDEAESIVAQAKADFEMEVAEKRKKALMDEYDDLSSEVRHLWGKHLKGLISWDELFDAAQSNWMALENSHDYSPADESEESLKLQIGIWKNFKEDLEYTVRVIHHQGSERGEIWLLKRLVIKPEREEQPTELQIQPLSDPEPKEEEGTDLPDKPTEEEDDRKARRKAYDQYVKASDHVFHRWGNVKFFEWQTFRKAMLTAYPDLNERVVSGHAGDKLSVKDLNLQTQIWKDVNADVDDAENGEGNWVGSAFDSRGTTHRTPNPALERS